MDLPAELAVAVEANAVEQITGVATNCSGITYPQGGWLCPAELTRNVLELAQQQGLQIYYQYELQNLSVATLLVVEFCRRSASNTQRSGTGRDGHQMGPVVQPKHRDSSGVFGCRAGQPYSDNAGTGRAEAGAVL